jgi:thymidine kinase
MAEGSEHSSVERSGTCESCGSDEVVAHVRRVYVTPASWDTAERVRAGGDEWWCFACRTHYPHQVLDASGRPVRDELA